MAGRQKQKKSNKTGAMPGLPPEARVAIEEIRRLAEEHPAGWAGLAEFLKDRPEEEVEGLLQLLARHLGKEALPLLRGAALDESDTLATAALRALPWMGTRAAGEVLVEAHQAYSDGERGMLAWQGVEALQARGINVSVPEPEGVRQSRAAYQVREVFETLPDGVGSRELIARVQNRYGVWHSVAVVWNDQAGVKDGFEMTMSRADWDEIRERNSEQGIILVPVSREYAQHQVARARALNEQTGFALEDHLDAWDKLVGPSEGELTLPDPLERVRGLSEQKRADLLEDADALFEEMVFQSWAVEPADVQPWFERWQPLAEKLWHGEGSDEDLEQAEKDLRELDAEIARSVITPAQADLWKSRMAEAVLKLNWLQATEEADILAAMLHELETAEDPATSTIYRMLVEGGLTLLAEIREDGQDPETLRYNPMEPIEDQQAAHQHAHSHSHEHGPGCQHHHH